MLVFLTLFGLFFATASRSLPYNMDALMNVLPAYEIATTGAPYLDDYQALHESKGNKWVTESSDGRLLSQYPPGTALIAVPLYWIPGWNQRTVLQLRAADRTGDVTLIQVEMPSVLPAAIAASMVTAAAMAILHLIFRQIVSGSIALLATYAIALGTSVWSIASGMLWQHGPTLLWLSLALYFLTTERHLGAGLMFGAAILTRPPSAVVAAVIGVLLAWQRRDWRPIVKIGFGSTLGLAALLLYNVSFIGQLSVSGGYGGGWAVRLRSLDFAAFGENVLGGLFHPTRGIVVWMPFLIVLSLGVRQGWKSASATIRAAALGGVAYLLLHYKLNRFASGGGFFATRYALEALMLVSPLALLAWRDRVASSPILTRLLVLSLAGSVTVQAVGAIG